MLKRNILYTGITRAKKTVYLVGDWRAVCQAVHNDDSGRRNTILGSGSSVFTSNISGTGTGAVETCGVKINFFQSEEKAGYSFYVRMVCFPEKGAEHERITVQKSKAVGSLNRVEGFEPLELARTISQEGQPDQLYLDVKYRKLWFRLVYPTGRIESHIVHFNENMALAEAKIYLSYTDAPENYIANAFSMKFRTDDPKFGDKFLEMAETAAVGRALSDAGLASSLPMWEKAMTRTRWMRGSPYRCSIKARMRSGTIHRQPGTANRPIRAARAQLLIGEWKHPPMRART